MKKKDRGILVTPGYYGREWSGRLVALDPAQVDRAPDHVICRRAADFGVGQIPPTAAFATCTRCGARIVHNPAGPHQDLPKICMQCARITPLPIVRPS